MIHFFDTSALVNYYTDEKGSAQATAIIQGPDACIFISELTCIEIKSSFALRTLDAIQLATHQQLPYPTVILACADERLNLLAREQTYVVWNPNAL